MTAVIQSNVPAEVISAFHALIQNTEWCQEKYTKPLTHHREPLSRAFI